MKQIATISMMALIVSSAHYCGSRQDDNVRPSGRYHHSCKDSTKVDTTVVPGKTAPLVK